jgi:hypothetical protein
MQLRNNTLHRMNINFTTDADAHDDITYADVC